MGWYHIVISIDTTDAVQADRCKIYVNGVRYIVDFKFASCTSYPNQNFGAMVRNRQMFVV